MIKVSLSSGEHVVLFVHKYADKFQSGLEGSVSKPVATVAILRKVKDGVDPDQPQSDDLMGEAHCHPKDQFNRSKGRKLALKHLFKAAGTAYEDRSKVWDSYFSYVGKRA